MAATAHAAEALGVSERVGRLSNGLIADLVLVEQDPLLSLDVWRLRLKCLKRTARSWFFA